MSEFIDNKICADGNMIYPRDKIIMTRPVESARHMILSDKDPVVLLAPKRLALRSVNPFEEIASAPIPQKLSTGIYNQILTATIFSTFFERYPSLLKNLCKLPAPHMRSHTIAMLNSQLRKKDFRTFMRAYGKLYRQNCHSTALHTPSDLLEFHPARILKNWVHRASQSSFVSINFMHMCRLIEKTPQQHKLLKWKFGQSSPEEIFINDNPHLVSIFDVHRDSESRATIWHTDIHSLIVFKLNSKKRKCAYYLAFEKAGFTVASSTIDGAVRFSNLTCSLNNYAKTCKHDVVILSLALED